MKSKPSYAPLILDETARRHLFVVEPAAIESVIRAVSGGGDLVCALPQSDRRVICAGVVDASIALKLREDAGVSLRTADDASAFVETLRDELSRADIGAAFYVGGSEVFVWDVTNRLRARGIENRRIAQELVGSWIRRVYCVHCGIINAEVDSTIHVCAGCGVSLTVRDHFSRPMNAYMGVRADAESPGDIPDSVRVFA